MSDQLAISPGLELWFAAAFLVLAVGGLALLVAQIRIRPYLPPEERPYVSVRDVFVYHVFQPQTPRSVRRLYVAALGAMTLAPFVGLVGVFAESRGDLVWPFVTLCAIASLTAFVIVRAGRDGPMPNP